MPHKQQSPAGRGGASRELLGGHSRDIDTALDWRRQLVARRHHLPLTLAGLVCAELFGEHGHDA